MALNAAQVSQHFKALRAAQAELTGMRREQLAVEAQSQVLTDQLNQVKAAIRRILEDADAPKEALDGLLRRAGEIRRDLDRVGPRVAPEAVQGVLAAVQASADAILDSL